MPHVSHRLRFVGAVCWTGASLLVLLVLLTDSFPQAVGAQAAAQDPRCVDLIVAGGPGKGKSTLANIAVGRVVFSSAFRATHVTTHHAKATAQALSQLQPDGSLVVVHDTPGLDQDSHYEHHRAQLHQAFGGPDSCGRQVLVFVLGVPASGRLNANDVHQLGAIVQAYDLRPESVLLVFNMLPQAVVDPEAYMAQVVAAMPPQLRPFAANRVSVPYLAGLATSDAQQLGAFVESTAGQAQDLRRSLATALALAKPGSARLVRPEALRSAAEAEEQLRQEVEQRRREQQRVEEERRAAEAQREQVRLAHARRNKRGPPSRPLPQNERGPPSWLLSQNKPERVPKGKWCGEVQLAWGGKVGGVDVRSVVMLRLMLLDGHPALMITKWRC